MSRRTPRPSTRGHHAHVAQAANHCRALVLVDGTVIRKKIKQDYEKALGDLGHSRRILEQFHETDHPQFTRWLNSHFGALLTELRELNQKMAADEAFVFLVENEVLFGGGSYARAYKRVMEIQENPEPASPLNENGKPDGMRDSFWSGQDYGGDPLEALYNDLFDAFGPGEDPMEHCGPPPRQRAGEASPPHISKRLKELYRAVVRLLHPDSQREMTAQKTEWWHQAQAAYEAGDAEQLEVILTLCEIGESGTTAHTSAGLLQRITAQLKSALREIKLQIAQLRRDPAWNFSGRTDHAAMADQVRRGLLGELSAMRRQWMETQELIAKWKAAAEKLKPSRRRRSPPPNPELPF